MVEVKYKRVRDTAAAPAYATAGAAGFDVSMAGWASPENPDVVYCQSLILDSLERAIIKTGLCLEIPCGYEAQVRPRSGLAAKYGITVLNTPGTIDSDYRGELQVIVARVDLTTADAHILKVGDRVAQVVVAPVMRAGLREADRLSETVRGDGGLGSTGVDVLELPAFRVHPTSDGLVYRHGLN